jgi:hypothetical protein
MNADLGRSPADVQPNESMPDSGRTRTRVAAVVAVVVVVAFVAWTILRPSSSGIEGMPWSSVIRVELVPIPEGSPPPPFEEDPTSTPAYDLARLTPYAPGVLPAPVDQHGCGNGANLLLTLSDGRTVTYGPCRYPEAIAHLWAGMFYVLTDGSCAPRCGPGGVPGP